LTEDIKTAQKETDMFRSRLFGVFWDYVKWLNYCF